MNPSVGRIVHYFTPRYSVIESEALEPELVPAIITKVHTPTCVNLAILGHPGFGDDIRSSDLGEGEPGTWCWPPRV